MKRKIGTKAFALSLLLAATGCQKAHRIQGLGSSILPVVKSTESKGLIMTTDNINSLNKSFCINAYLDEEIASIPDENFLEEELISDKSDFHFIKSAIVEYTGDGSSHSWDWAGVPSPATEEEKDAARPKWRTGIASRFWSCYPAEMADEITWLEGTPTNDQQKTLTFSYEMPEPATAAPFNDAESQQDVLFAFNEQTCWSQFGGNTIGIHFYHTMAAVNFDITTMGGSVDFGEGPSISLKHIRYSGDCTIIGPELGAPVDAVDGAGTSGVAWSNLSTDFKDFSQSFSRNDDFGSIEIENNGTCIRQKASGNKTFFLIPQTLSGASLEIGFDYKSGGVPIVLEKPLDNDILQAGKIYTYRITLCDNGGSYTLLDVALDVKDWVDGKKDVTF